MKFTSVAVLIATLTLTAPSPVFAANLCQEFGPQTPRDMSDPTDSTP